MRILLTGATGFIGSHLRRALLAAGHRLRCVARAPPPREEGIEWVRGDYTRDRAAADWLPRLYGIDAVINAVGILREHGAQTFEALHRAAPCALFSACAAAGVPRVLQISALGADQQAASRYHLSKKAADDCLRGLPLQATVIQPSLVFGADGASTQLFCTLASLPLLPLPGGGAQRVQPVHVDDLVDAVCRLLEPGHLPACLAVVGPQPLGLGDYLQSLRRSLGLGRVRLLRVPVPLARAGARAARLWRGALLDPEALAMLERGNTADPAPLRALLGRDLRPPPRFIDAERAAELRRTALLGWLLPLLRLCLAAMWIWTGIVSLGLYPVAQSYELLARTGLRGDAASIALYGAASLDLALGFALLLLRQRLWVWRLQLGLMLAYTALLSVFLPEYWLHPYGPVLKNLPLLAATYLACELERR